MISHHEAITRVLEHVRPLRTTRVPLDRAIGYCLAEDVRADRDLPPADRSAMDGFAVRRQDLASQPCSLRLVGEVAAGSPARPRVRRGTCVRILTGGNIPPGADTVVMVEQTRRTNGTVTVLSGVDRGANILRKAEDARQGDILIARGTAIGPMQVGICAAVGKSSVCVHLRPRVSVLCTGEELRGIDEAVRPHEIRNSNGFALCSALRTYGFADVACSIVPDDIQVLLAALRRAVRRSDLVLLTGGVSAGKYDFVPEAVMKLGSTIRFHGVAIKPGKPLLSATLPGNRHIFGLPGNPLSTMNCYFEFILPALRRLCGFQAETCHPSLRVPLASRISSKGGGRARFVLARLRWSRQGPCVEPVKSHSSADLVAGGQADGTILVPPTVRGMKAGTLVEFRPWRPLP